MTGVRGSRCSGCFWPTGFRSETTVGMSGEMARLCHPGSTVNNPGRARRRLPSVPAASPHPAHHPPGDDVHGVPAVSFRQDQGALQPGSFPARRAGSATTINARAGTHPVAASDPGFFNTPITYGFYQHWLVDPRGCRVYCELFGLKSWCAGNPSTPGLQDTGSSRNPTIASHRITPEFVPGANAGHGVT